jgi:glutamyl-tRNA(Gln) amidotransferase subunit E
MDYAALGLKAGLEIHQQVNSATKLFCRCPTTVRDDVPDVIVTRRLRASAGESGAVDVAAAYEQQRGKHFIYQGYNETTCAVELDEEPVHPLSEEALLVAQQAALLLHATPVDSICVMRKTVVDGSNTSGFQRTALVARNGSFQTLSGAVRISSICLEEDSAKIVKREPGCDTYNLSRLGIPLIEIATEPDIKTSAQLREAAEYLGMILRSTGKVKRGLGTIRQDVNVSIKGGERVEIKGAQDLRLLTKFVEFEAQRQQNLLAVRDELKKRKANAKTEHVDLTTLFAKSESKLIRSALDDKGMVLGMVLHGFSGILGREIQPGRRVGTELSDYAKAFAGVSGILHSDELPKYGITAQEAAAVFKKLACGKHDAFVLVGADSAQADAGCCQDVSRNRRACCVPGF